jgi:NAD+ synthase (glutamine-hydrolysing)
MKVYNPTHSNLTPNIKKTLSDIKNIRAFNVQKYIQAKSLILNEYMLKCGLDSCVVALSGGIDSSTVLSLVSHASKQEGSPIKRIVAVTIPSFDGSVTNQHSTIKRASELCQHLDIKLNVLDITNDVKNLATSIEKSMQNNGLDMWARGQLVSYVRTPSLYYYTSVLNSQGFRPILVGTINRDEGAYLGYLCKSGDGCVDIQLISDLHKSEVYAVARELNVPNSSLTAIPTGDMYDARTDEEVFGAPYDFVELFLSHKTLSKNTWKSLTVHWTHQDFEQFSIYSQSLESLHKYNLHKYMGGSPAIHLDVLSSAIPNGWIEGVHTTIHKATPYLNPLIINTSKFVGFIDNSPPLDNYVPLAQSSNTTHNVNFVENVLNNKEREDFIAWVNNNTNNLIKTNQFGYTKGDSLDGSSRLSFYDQQWAQIIFERLLISGAIDPIFNCELENANTNWAPFKQWRAIGLNPLFRVMKYSQNNLLLPHYDDSFYQSSSRRSLKSVVIVVKSANIGGKTRFLIDSQDNLPFSSRDFSDKTIPGDANDVLSSFGENGSAIVFNHRLLHDGEQVIEGDKIIIRTDVMYESTSF